MPIADRDLKVGTRLVARYKKDTYFATVVAGEGGGIAYRLDDGETYKSISAAGMAILGEGRTCNGWAFWSVEGADPVKATIGIPRPRGERTEKKVREPKAKKGKKNGNLMVLYRMEDQSGVEEGEVKWFCSACLAAFFVAGTEEPESCPAGHEQGKLGAEEMAPALAD